MHTVTKLLAARDDARDSSSSSWVVVEAARADHADVEYRGHSRPEIPEISKLSWNCPEITDCPEISGIW